VHSSEEHLALFVTSGAWRQMIMETWWRKKSKNNICHFNLQDGILI